MSEILSDLDEIICRTGVSYAKAKEMFDRNNGDVLQAIIAIEQEPCAKPWNMQTWQNVLEKSRSSKIKILKDGAQVGEIPLSAGILGLAGTLLWPRFTAIGAIGSLAAVFNNVSMQIENSEETNRPTKTEKH